MIGIIANHSLCVCYVLGYVENSLSIHNNPLKYRYTSEVLWIWFQTTEKNKVNIAIKLVTQVLGFSGMLKNYVYTAIVLCLKKKYTLQLRFMLF